MNDLGATISVHNPDKRKLATARVLATALMVVGALLGVGSIVAAAIWLFADGGGVLPAALGGGTLFLLLIGWLAGSLTRLRGRVGFVVHEEGLEIHEGGETSLVRWEEIKTVFVEVSNERCEGPVVDIDPGVKSMPLGYMWLENAEQLQQAIVQDTFKRMLDDSLAALKRGEPVAFGKLKVDRAGMQFPNGTSIRWKDVVMMAADFSTGELLLTRQGSELEVEWRPGRPKEGSERNIADYSLMVWTGDDRAKVSLKVSQIENVHVFLKLAQIILRPRKSA
jgi:hypothetical protein